MPRTRASSAASSKPEEAVKSSEPEKHSEAEEKVDLDEENEHEETDEEVEYEEVEEEVEGKKKHFELLALPPHGSEVFLGGIPHDAAENDIRSFCEHIGEIHEVRVMKGKDAGENKGYAFVMFKTKELAFKAMEKLNNTELKGRKIKCSSSQAKHKLFLGNVPKTWGEEDLRKVVIEVGPGIHSIDLLKDPQNSSCNRGFAFIEYYNHACAEYSRQKMSNSNFKLCDNSPTVSWADPKNAESSAASQVKAIYIKNLPKDVTSDKLKELFGHHGAIAKVVLSPAKVGHENSRFGFIHFAERSSAMKALKNTERYEIDGQVLECSLAKPQADQKSFGGAGTQKLALLPSYQPHVGGGPPPAPAGMSMMPMLLPDGRIGYVLQQPGMQPMTSQHGGGRGGGGGVRGGSSGGGKRGGDSNYVRSRCNPY